MDNNTTAVTLELENVSNNKRGHRNNGFGTKHFLTILHYHSSLNIYYILCLATQITIQLHYYYNSFQFGLFCPSSLENERKSWFQLELEAGSFTEHTFMLHKSIGCNNLSQSLAIMISE